MAALLVGLALICLPAGPAEAAPDGLEEGPEEEVALLLPDLVNLPPSDLRLIIDRENDRRILRFSNTIANIGEGPLEVKGRRADDGEGYQVSQRLYGSNDELLAEPVLSRIEFHSEHDHWHLEGFARYELWEVDAGGELLGRLRTSGKVSYCLMNTESIYVSGEGSEEYLYCSPELQGISPGWGDRYHADLAGQWIDVTDLPPGVYALRSVADPDDHLQESNERNNDGLIYFTLSSLEVEVQPVDQRTLPLDLR